jgi:serine/threonine protein kinase
MIANMAERVCDLHARGWVHRDLKPGNIMWLPRTNRWTVIDFGCAAPIGVCAPLSFTLGYAAPEIAIALAEGHETITSDASMDAWSVGVIAFELLTGQSAFKMFRRKEDVRYPTFTCIMKSHRCLWHACVLSITSAFAAISTADHHSQTWCRLSMV